MNLPRQNNRDELLAFEEVCRQLSGFEPLMHFEWADGFMTALCTAPVWPPADDEWLPAMCQDAFDRAFADPEDRARALRVLNTRLAVMRDQLDPEALSDRPHELRLDPLLAEPTPAEGDEPGFALAETWASGLLQGAAYAHRDAQFDADGDDGTEFEQLLGRIMLLAKAGGSMDPKEREPLFVQALYAVQDLRLWALDTLPRVEQRRVEKAPGRNDPCPCGSGKKYKKCHGAAAP